MSSNVAEIIKTGKLQPVALTSIKVPSYHDRTDVDDESIESLANNMSEVGQISPIILEKTGEEQFEIISGLRRLSAASKLNWSEIDAIVLENLDEKARMLIMIAENAQRQNLNDYDLVVSLIHFLAISVDKTDDDIKAFFYKLKNYDSGNIKSLTFEEKKFKKSLEDAIKQTDKYTIKSLIGKLKVLNFQPEIIKAMQEHRLLFTYAVLLNRIKDEEKMKNLLTLFISKQLNKQELKKEVRGILGADKKTIPFTETIKKLRSFNEMPEEKQKVLVDKMKEVEALIAS